MNRLFVAYKPPYISSNHFLSRLKRKYKTKKAGFSGTLDPFAQGVLVVAMGDYTRLLSHISTAPKTYKAVLWLGAFSPTLDIEGIISPQVIPPVEEEKIHDIFSTLQGVHHLSPPSFSAKHINGKRAYELAREGQIVNLATVPMEIFDCHLLHYAHPFITFTITVSKGSYIRTIGELIASRLNTQGSLSYLERLSEGKFHYENERSISPEEALDYPHNRFFKDESVIIKGQKLHADDFSHSTYGRYTLVCEETLSIIDITEEKVSYVINNLKKTPCSF